MLINFDNSLVEILNALTYL